ncbi:hypothetical protein SAMN05880582_1127 [Rhizobium sp. RU20A]|uniref:DUF6030 family protein n=1 Tax=Rhizobium sp. RU20A TaxID=1907412 RepID=UPI000953D101|nr:DUF6030 family protein [Rhizobium sp. RU20A]SIR39247.1 hypothetical protein SAMN05880582_1127 [Rhizobium sp. RU20A]
MSLKSPQFFFLALLAAIIIAIGATFLLANDKRNLRQLLLHFGVELTHVPERNGARLPQGPQTAPTDVRPKVVALPSLLFADFGVPEQGFSRVILLPPEAICDRLREAGFSQMERQKAFARQGWECSVLKTVGSGGDDETPKSSIFVFIRVDGKDNRVESFRVKINIERPEDRLETLSLAVRAADVFLRFVRWDNSGEITQRIAGLEEFNMTRFGSRLSMKREMGDVPRYNFYAAELVRPKPEFPFDAYFDRDRWLPYLQGESDIRLPPALRANLPVFMSLSHNGTPSATGKAPSER